MRHLMLRAVAALAIVSGASEAWASPILDQNNSTPQSVAFPNSHGIGFQQQVTAGLTGLLTAVTVYASQLIGGGNPGMGSAEVRIALGPAFTTGPFVFDQVVQLSTPTNYAPIDVSAAHIMLTAGSQFVIDILGGSGTPAVFIAGLPTPYAGGDLFQYNPTNGAHVDLTTSQGFSLAFQTFVDVPEPSSLALLAVGLLAVGAVRGRRSRRGGPARA